MINIGRMLTGAVIGLSFSLPTPSNAFPGSPPAMKSSHRQQIAFGNPSLAPMAYTRFCMRYPSECESRVESRRDAVTLTHEKWLELHAVNRKVNELIAPERNVGGLMTEQWVIAPSAGDCNDYAVTKRHDLLERGWPPHALILAEVVTSWGEHHLVLVVRTDQADVVLDNLRRDIRPVAQVGYRWVRAQSPIDPKFWSTVRIQTSREHVAAVRREPRVMPGQVRTTIVLQDNKAGDCCRRTTVARPNDLELETGKSASAALKSWKMAAAYRTEMRSAVHYN